MSRELTILVVPLDAAGHILACIGISHQLRDRGHKVVFAVPDGWKNKLSPLGFIEEWMNPESEVVCDQVELETLGEIVAKLAPAFLLSPEDQVQHLLHPFYIEAMRHTKESNAKLRRIVDKVKPDVILADLIFQQPAIMDAGIPYVLSFSITPTSISSKNVPPAFSGYPTAEEHRKSWESYMAIYRSAFEDDFKDFKKWVIGNGGPKDLKFNQLFLKYSPYANIYQCVEELDYTEFRPNPPNWHRFDTFVRSTKEEFELPANLKGKPGKLIYFSMGTIGCCELNMMRRLTSILAKSPHRFIVSKGPLGDQLELADNMWGAKSVPQTKVLPLVDLVITHGGNNTVTESFYFGKPVIVLPLFGDQLDNAQRVAETGFGIRLHSRKVKEGELLTAIEELLSNSQLSARMAVISKRMQSSNCQSRAAELIEGVATGKVPN